MTAEAASELTGSIVMATHGRARRAAATVERLLALPEAWPVIVVDDASPDDTAPLLRERFGDRIRVIRLGDNRGSAARNAGVEAARTDLVAFSDDDSWWAPGALDRAARVMASAPEIGLTAASVRVEPGGRPDPVTTALGSSPLPSTRWGPSVLGFLACAAVVRRDAFLGVGGFHPLLHIGGEEELLALDMRSAGWELVHVPDVVAHHHPLPTDAGRRDRETRLLRNRLWVRLIRRRPSDAAAEALGTLWAARSAGPARDAARETVAMLPRLVRERRRLPPTVDAAARSLERQPRAGRRTMRWLGGGRGDGSAADAGSDDPQGGGGRSLVS